MANLQMVNIKPVREVVDLVNTWVAIGFGQNQMQVDEIFPNPVNRAESHFRKQGHPCLYRVQLELADLSVFRKKVMEQSNRPVGFPLQEVVNRMTATGVRLVGVIES